MGSLSQTDIGMLKDWVKVLHPFPVRMSVCSYVNGRDWQYCRWVAMEVDGEFFLSREIKTTRKKDDFPHVINTLILGSTLKKQETINEHREEVSKQ